MRVPQRLSERPFYLLLLPLAFAAYGLSVQYGRARVVDALQVAAGLALLLGALTLILRPVLRRWSTAALGAAFGGLATCFWSYPVLRLKAVFPDAFFTRLPVLLLAMALLWAVLTGFTARTAPAGRNGLSRFLNLLFAVLLVVNGVTAALRYRAARADLPAQVPVTAAQANRPPVFVLLFDEYGSPASLERNGIGTDGVTGFLQDAGFFVATRARAAYPITHFSVAAALNGAYTRTDTTRAITLRDYNDALVRIRHARLPQAFQQAGYVLRNRSVFRIGSEPPFEGHSPLVEGIDVLLAGTLWEDVLRPLWLKRFAPGHLEAAYFDGIRRSNALARTITADAAAPGSFISYAHFFLPHAPFVFGADGRRLSFEKSLQQSADNDVRGYTANLRVATALLKQCVASIRRQRSDALILVLGDHGYRNERLRGNDTARFQALCAVYYPDRKYTGWTDSTGLVNAFRLLTAKALNVSLPLLPERSLSLHDQTGLDW